MTAGGDDTCTTCARAPAPNEVAMVHGHRLKVRAHVGSLRMVNWDYYGSGAHVLVDQEGSVVAVVYHRDGTTYSTSQTDTLTPAGELTAERIRARYPEWVQVGGDKKVRLVRQGNHVTGMAEVIADLHDRVGVVV